MQEKSLKFLKDLINSSSPSGFEDSASEIWGKYLSDYQIPVKKDLYGNSIASVNFGGFPKIMLCGHIDEVGFMVNYISDEGYIYISSIGGVDPSISLAQKLTIHNKNGPVCGIIGQKPIHLEN